MSRGGFEGSRGLPGQGEDGAGRGGHLVRGSRRPGKVGDRDRASPLVWGKGRGGSEELAGPVRRSRGGGPGGAVRGHRGGDRGKNRKATAGRSAPKAGECLGEPLGDASGCWVGDVEGRELLLPSHRFSVALTSPHPKCSLPRASCLAHTTPSCRPSEAGPKGSERREGM